MIKNFIEETFPQVEPDKPYKQVLEHLKGPQPTIDKVSSNIVPTT